MLLICIHTELAVPLRPNSRVNLAGAEHFGPKINVWLCSCLIRLEVLYPGWRGGAELLTDHHLLVIWIRWWRTYALIQCATICAEWLCLEHVGPNYFNLQLSPLIGRGWGYLKVCLTPQHGHQQWWRLWSWRRIFKPVWHSLPSDPDSMAHKHQQISVGHTATVVAKVNGGVWIDYGGWL